MENFTHDSGWIVIWEDIKNGGVPLLIFSGMMIMWFLKSHINNIFLFLGRLITKKIDNSVKEYSALDVKNHPVFRDLEFWLTVGVKSLRMYNINSQYPTIHDHVESPEYLKAKEDIAKDILVIKYQIIKEYIELFLKENPIDHLNLETLRSSLLTYLHKCEIKQHSEMLDQKIPSEFLKKYFVYEKMSSDLFYQTIEGYLNEGAFNNLNVTTRLYLVFSAINSYLTNCYNNMIYTVAVINGDLNGVEYKGHIIGKKKQKILQPPHSTFVYPVKEKLTSILSEFHASRVSLMKYYTNSDNEYVHSAVYEVCAPGIMPVLANIQNIPNNMEMDVIDILKHGTIISVDVSKFNNNIIERLSQRGVDAVILAPIFEGNEFSGILVLDYVSLEEYNKCKDNPCLDAILSKYAKELTTYISYPKNYIY